MVDKFNIYIEDGKKILDLTNSWLQPGDLPALAKEIQNSPGEFDIIKIGGEVLFNTSSVLFVDIFIKEPSIMSATFQLEGKAADDEAFHYLIDAIAAYNVVQNLNLQVMAEKNQANPDENKIDSLLTQIDILSNFDSRLPLHLDRKLAIAKSSYNATETTILNQLLTTALKNSDNSEFERINQQLITEMLKAENISNLQRQLAFVSTHHPELYATNSIPAVSDNNNNNNESSQKPSANIGSIAVSSNSNASSEIDKVTIDFTSCQIALSEANIDLFNSVLNNKNITEFKFNLRSKDPTTSSSVLISINNYQDIPDFFIKFNEKLKIKSSIIDKVNALSKLIYSLDPKTDEKLVSERITEIAKLQRSNKELYQGYVADFAIIHSVKLKQFGLNGALIEYGLVDSESYSKDDIDFLKKFVTELTSILPTSVFKDTQSEFGKLLARLTSFIANPSFRRTQEDPFLLAVKAAVSASNKFVGGLFQKKVDAPAKFFDLILAISIRYIKNLLKDYPYYRAKIASSNNKDAILEKIIEIFTNALNLKNIIIQLLLEKCSIYGGEYLDFDYEIEAIESIKRHISTLINSDTVVLKLQDSLSLLGQLDLLSFQQQILSAISINKIKDKNLLNLIIKISKANTLSNLTEAVSALVTFINSSNSNQNIDEIQTINETIQLHLTAFNKIAVFSGVIGFKDNNLNRQDIINLENSKQMALIAINDIKQKNDGYLISRLIKLMEQSIRLLSTDSSNEAYTYTTLTMFQMGIFNYFYKSKIKGKYLHDFLTQIAEALSLANPKGKAIDTSNDPSIQTAIINYLLNITKDEFFKSPQADATDYSNYLSYLNFECISEFYEVENLVKEINEFFEKHEKNNSTGLPDNFNQYFNEYISLRQRALSILVKIMSPVVVKAEELDDSKKKLATETSKLRRPLVLQNRVLTIFNRLLANPLTLTPSADVLQSNPALKDQLAFIDPNNDLLNAILKLNLSVERLSLYLNASNAVLSEASPAKFNVLVNCKGKSSDTVIKAINKLNENGIFDEGSDPSNNIFLIKRNVSQREAEDITNQLIADSIPLESIRLVEQSSEYHSVDSHQLLCSMVTAVSPIFGKVADLPNHVMQMLLQIRINHFSSLTNNLAKHDDQSDLNIDPETLLTSIKKVLSAKQELLGLWYSLREKLDISKAKEIFAIFETLEKIQFKLSTHYKNKSKSYIEIFELYIVTLLQRKSCEFYKNNEDLQYYLKDFIKQISEAETILQVTTAISLSKTQLFDKGAIIEFLISIENYTVFSMRAKTLSKMVTTFSRIHVSPANSPNSNKQTFLSSNNLNNYNFEELFNDLKQLIEEKINLLSSLSEIYPNDDFSLTIALDDFVNLKRPLVVSEKLTTAQNKKDHKDTFNEIKHFVEAINTFLNILIKDVKADKVELKEFIEILRKNIPINHLRFPVAIFEMANFVEKLAATYKINIDKIHDKKANASTNYLILLIKELSGFTETTNPNNDNNNLQKSKILDETPEKIIEEIISSKKSLLISLANSYPFKDDKSILAIYSLQECLSKHINLDKLLFIELQKIVFAYYFSEPASDENIPKFLLAIAEFNTTDDIELFLRDPKQLDIHKLESLKNISKTLGNILSINSKITAFQLSVNLFTVKIKLAKDSGEWDKDNSIVSDLKNIILAKKNLLTELKHNPIKIISDRFMLAANKLTNSISDFLKSNFTETHRANCQVLSSDLDVLNKQDSILKVFFTLTPTPPELSVLFDEITTANSSSDITLAAKKLVPSIQNNTHTEKGLSFHKERFNKSLLALSMLPDEQDILFNMVITSGGYLQLLKTTPTSLVQNWNDSLTVMHNLLLALVKLLPITDDHRELALLSLEAFDKFLTSIENNLKPEDAAQVSDKPYVMRFCQIAFQFAIKGKINSRHFIQFLKDISATNNALPIVSALEKLTADLTTAQPDDKDIWHNMVIFCNDYLQYQISKLSTSPNVSNNNNNQNIYNNTKLWLDSISVMNTSLLAVVQLRPTTDGHKKTANHLLVSLDRIITSVESNLKLEDTAQVSDKIYVMKFCQIAFQFAVNGAVYPPQFIQFLKDIGIANNKAELNQPFEQLKNFANPNIKKATSEGSHLTPLIISLTGLPFFHELDKQANSYIETIKELAVKVERGISIDVDNSTQQLTAALKSLLEAQQKISSFFVNFYPTPDRIYLQKTFNLIEKIIFTIQQKTNSFEKYESLQTYLDRQVNFFKTHKHIMNEIVDSKAKKDDALTTFMIDIASASSIDDLIKATQSLVKHDIFSDACAKGEFPKSKDANTLSKTYPFVKEVIRALSPFVTSEPLTAAPQQQ